MSPVTPPPGTLGGAPLTSQPPVPQALPGSPLPVPDAWRNNPAGYQRYIQDTAAAQRMRNESQVQIDRMNRFPGSTGGHGLSPAQTQAAYNQRYGRIAPNPTGASHILTGGLVQEKIPYAIVDEKGNILDTFEESRFSNQAGKPFENTREVHGRDPLEVYNESRSQGVIGKAPFVQDAGPLLNSLRNQTVEKQPEKEPITTPIGAGLMEGITGPLRSAGAGVLSSIINSRTTSEGKKYLEGGSGMLTSPSPLKSNVQLQLSTMGPALETLRKDAAGGVVGIGTRVMELPGAVMDKYNAFQTDVSGKIKGALPKDILEGEMSVGYDFRKGILGRFIPADQKQIAGIYPELGRGPAMKGSAELGGAYIHGEVKGIMEKPVDATLLFAATFALPEVGYLGRGVISRSSRLTKIAASEYVPKVGSLGERILGKGASIPIGKFFLGEVETRAPVAAREVNYPATKVLLPEIGGFWERTVPSRLKEGATTIEVVKDWLITKKTFTPPYFKLGLTEIPAMKGTVEGAAGSGRYINIPIATAEITIGTMWTQSVIERVSGSAIPAHLDIGLPGSARPGFSWGINLDKLPSGKTMAGTAGEITSTELIPAAAGAIAGDMFWTKINALAKTRGDTRVNLAPEEPRDSPLIGKEEIIPGGLGYEGMGYPVNPQATRKGGSDLLKSFERGTLIPEPVKLAGTKPGQSKAIDYVPFHAFLPGENPKGTFMWTGWETDPGRVGSMFKLESGSSEITGMYGAPVAEGHFTKAGTGVEDRWQIFGIGVPKVREPTLVRTEGTRFEVLPEGIRGKGYPEINQWMSTHGEPGVVYLPLKKMEYEGVLSAFTTEGRVQLKVNARDFYTVIRGERVPIVQAEVGPAIPWDVVNGQARVGYIEGKPVGLPGEHILEGNRPLTFSEEQLLGRMNPRDRKATEALFNVGNLIGDMNVPNKGPIDFSKVKTVGTGRADALEQAIAKYNPIVYGSSTRLGQVTPTDRIPQLYGRWPGDVDLRTEQYIPMARDIAKSIGGHTRIHAYGVEVSARNPVTLQKEIVADIHPMKGTMGDNPFGWKPDTFVQQKGYRYETLADQVKRGAYGSLMGREDWKTGEWTFGPRPHRTEKDITRFYGDVQFILEKQTPGSPAVLSVRDSMRDLRTHSMVKEVLGNRKFRYGPGKDEFFSGIPLDRTYIGGTTKRALIEPTELGIGAMAVSALHGTRNERVLSSQGGETKASIIPETSPLSYRITQRDTVNPGSVRVYEKEYPAVTDLSSSVTDGLSPLSVSSRSLPDSSLSNISRGSLSPGRSPGLSSISGNSGSSRISGGSSVGRSSISSLSSGLSLLDSSSIGNLSSGISISGGPSSGGGRSRGSSSISLSGSGLSGGSRSRSIISPPTTELTPPTLIVPPWPPVTPRKKLRREEKTSEFERHATKDFFPFGEIAPVASGSEFVRINPYGMKPLKIDIKVI